VEWPVAEIEVDESLVGALLAEQHPDLAGLPIQEMDAGWDNTLWRLGDELLVRLPRHASSALLTANEQRWLPDLAPCLPLPVPAPLRVGVPSGRYPWPWSVVPWLAGSPGDRTTLTRPDDAARCLGRFLRALHRRAPDEAPRNPVRGVPLIERRDVFEERVRLLGTEIDVVSTRRVFDRAVASRPWSGPPVWLHGDLHPANTLVEEGTLAAIIDFGDICGGDPATDVAGAWMLLPAPAMEVFTDAYGAVDGALEQRSLGWAVFFGVILLEIGLRDRPTYATVGRATLAKAILRSDQT